MRRSSWQRQSPPGDKVQALWVHNSGWAVRHCGHPTANYPYFAEHPDGGPIVVSHNGRGFRTLFDAMLAVELLSAGVLALAPAQVIGRITARRAVRAAA